MQDNKIHLGEGWNVSCGIYIGFIALKGRGEHSDDFV